MLDLERDPLFKMHDIHDLTKPQLRERTLEKVREFATDVIGFTHLGFQ